jgi:O-antigen/teichoic acid export membrane protein
MKLALRKYDWHKISPWLQSYFSDSLRRNAIFLMLSGGVSALLGFFFWLIAARLYSATEVGLATVIISMMNLFVMISKLGFDFSLIRFLPASNSKHQLINTCLTIAGINSLAVAGVFILGIDIWAPKISIISENWLYIITFMLFTCFAVISQLQGQIFIAFRASHIALFTSIISGAKILFVIILASFGAFGIFTAMGLPSILIVAFSIICMMKISGGYRPALKINRNLNAEMIRFSLGNYAIAALSALSTYIIPLIIINVLTADASAYYNIPFSIASILGLIISSTSTALLTEGSYSQYEFKKQCIKAIKFILSFLIPAILILSLFGKIILSWFGAEYTQNSLTLLKLFSISYLPNIVILLYLTVLKVKKNIRAMIITGLVMTLLILGLSYIFLNTLGLNGVGIGFLSAQIIMAIGTGILMIRLAIGHKI